MNYREINGEEANPLHIFAFGLGDTPIEKSIGQFKVKLATKPNGDATETKTEFPVELCSSNTICADLFRDHFPESLYFPKDYTGEIDFNFENELTISFETCSEEPECVTPM